MKQKVIVGVDISKGSLDIYFKPTESSLLIDNSVAGFKYLYKQLKQTTRSSELLIVMEHTGRYSCKLEAFLRSKGIDYCKVPALQIKRSLGMVRGKDDKIDAKRIADYAWLRRELLIADRAVSSEISRLRELLNLRSKIVRDRAGYVSRLKELSASDTLDKDLKKIHDDILKNLSKHITALEKKIKELIKLHEPLKKTYELLTSLKGVGLIVAAFMICTTANFTRFLNARKFNCYAGLAPFKHESGTSIKGRTRVSHLANKEAKTLLNLAASCAIRHDPELKQYYQRRVSEGKRKMSCLNIIRTKIVARMYAVIKRQTRYELMPIAA